MSGVAKAKADHILISGHDGGTGASGVPPIIDPEIPEDFPVKPIRPWLDGLEDHITPHLPPSLHRNSLGFSPVLLILFTLLFLIALLTTYPLRRQARTFCLRALRRVAKPDRNSYALEEGQFLNGNGPVSRPPSPTSRPAKWLRPLCRLLAPKSKHSRPLKLAVFAPSSRNLRNEPVTPTRISPIRSYSLPVISNHGGSRSPSPLPPSPNGFNDDTNGGSSSFSPSRNGSQLNLKSLLLAVQPVLFFLRVLNRHNGQR